MSDPYNDGLRMLADQIALCVPDGTLLHTLIAEVPGGRRVAGKMPGSAVGSFRLAHGIALDEAKGGAPEGFVAAVLDEARCRGAAMVGNQDQATKPVWANLRFIGGARTRVAAALVHGMPPIGAQFNAEEGFGTVTGICYAPTTDGSYKATIEVEVSP